LERIHQSTMVRMKEVRRDHVPWSRRADYECMGIPPTDGD
jgi:hypothetical protein